MSRQNEHTHTNTNTLTRALIATHLHSGTKKVKQLYTITKPICSEALYTNWLDRYKQTPVSKFSNTPTRLSFCYMIYPYYCMLILHNIYPYYSFYCIFLFNTYHSTCHISLFLWSETFKQHIKLYLL